MANDPTPFNYSGKLAFLEAACRDPQLQRTDLAVLSVLVNHANQATGMTFCSVDTITKLSGVPKTTALRALRRLDEAGQVRTEKRFGASSTYWLTGSIAGTGATTGTGSVDGTGANWNRTGAIQGLRVGRTGSGYGTEPVPAVEPEQKKAKATEKEQQVLTLENDQETSGRFLEFWRPYPRKDGKAKALQLWTSRKLDAHADKILADVTARIADPGQWDDPKFIPHASTYLGQQRWLDEWKRSTRGSVTPLLPRDARPQSEIDAANELALSRLGGSLAR